MMAAALRQLCASMWITVGAASGCYNKSFYALFKNRLILLTYSDRSDNFSRTIKTVNCPLTTLKHLFFQKVGSVLLNVSRCVCLKDMINWTREIQSHLASIGHNTAYTFYISRLNSMQNWQDYGDHPKIALHLILLTYHEVQHENK